HPARHWRIALYGRRAVLYRRTPAVPPRHLAQLRHGRRRRALCRRADRRGVRLGSTITARAETYSALLTRASAAADKLLQHLLATRNQTLSGQTTRESRMRFISVMRYAASAAALGGV